MPDFDSKGALRSVVEQYFWGERTEMLVLLATSAVLIATAIFLLRSGDLFARGLSMPLIFTVLVFGSTAVSLLARDTKNKATLLQRMTESEDAVRSAERARIETVISKYPVYRYIYAAAILAALAIFIFVKRPVWQGVAVGLLCFAAIGYIVDHYSEQRARRYQSRL